MTLRELLEVVRREIPEGSATWADAVEGEVRSLYALGPGDSLAEFLDTAAFGLAVARLLGLSAARYRVRGGYLERTVGAAAVGESAWEAYRRYGDTMVHAALAPDGDARAPIPGDAPLRALGRVVRHDGALAAAGKAWTATVWVIGWFAIPFAMVPTLARQCVRNARVRRRERQARACGLPPLTAPGEYVPYPFLVNFWPLLGFGLTLAAGWVTGLPPGPWWVRLPVIVAAGDGVALLAWVTLVPIVVMNQVGLANARHDRVAAGRNRDPHE